MSDTLASSSAKIDWNNASRSEKQRFFDNAYARLSQPNHSEISFIHTVDDVIQGMTNVYVTCTPQQQERVAEIIRSHGYISTRDGFEETNIHIRGREFFDLTDAIKAGKIFGVGFAVSDLANRMMAQILDELDKKHEGKVDAWMSECYRELCDQRHALAEEQSNIPSQKPKVKKPTYNK